MIERVGSRYVWLMAAMMMVAGLFIATPTAMAGEPESEVSYTEPFRVVQWWYLPQSEDFGNEWGADVVLGVDYDGLPHSGPDAYFVLDWPCFFELLVGKNALNDYVSVPYGPAGENYDAGWLGRPLQRLLQIEQTVTP